jgi:hypothetical protein
MSALGRYILASTLLFSATLCALFATLANSGSRIAILSVLALITYTGAFRALGLAFYAESQNLKKD